MEERELHLLAEKPLIGWRLFQLRDSAHDRDPPIYAEVACSGRVFIDVRGVRAQRIEILRLAMRTP